MGCVSKKISGVGGSGGEMICMGRGKGERIERRGVGRRRDCFGVPVKGLLLAVDIIGMVDMVGFGWF